MAQGLRCSARGGAELVAAALALIAVSIVGLLAILAPRVARAQEPSASEAEVRALWSDGAELFGGGGSQTLVLYDREGEQAREPVGVELFVDAAGTRAGRVLAVFAAADGTIIRWRPGEIGEDHVPLLDGDELVAVTVDASGTIYAIGRERALYERGSLRWRIHPYPTHMRPLAAVASPGGQVYIVGRDGLLVRFRDDEWDRPLVPGLSAESIRAPWYDAWYSAVTETLWVRVGRDRLLELEFGEQREASEGAPAPEPIVPLDPDEDEEAEDEQAEDDEAEDDEGYQAPPPTLHVSGSVPAHEHPIPIGPPVEGETPAGFTGIAGVSAAGGDRVVVSAGDRVWMWDHGRFVLIGEEIPLVYDITLDEGAAVAWIATRDGVVRQQMRSIEDAADDAIEEERLIQQLRRRDAWRLRNSTLPRFFWMPTVRVDNGVVFPIGADPIAGYSLEIGAGAVLAPLTKDRGPTLWVWPELAYRYELHPTRGGHLFDLGFGTHLVAAFYRPRLVLGGITRGTDEGPGVYGIRQGIALQAIWGVLGLEVSHQYLGSNQGALNDFRVGLSVNLAPLVWIGILWATIPTGK